MPEAELHLCMGGNIAQVLILCINFAYPQRPVITMIAAVIGHGCVNVVCTEIEGQLTIIQQQHAIAQIGATDCQVEEPLHWLGIVLLDLRLGCVGCAIGIDDEVKHRPIEPDILQVNSRLQKGDDVQPHVGAIRVRIGELVGPFTAVDSQIVGLEFKLPKIPVKRPADRLGRRWHLPG